MLFLISLPVNFCSATMASRRSKDKHPAKTSKQIVKKEPISPLEVANWFTTLATISKPNYSTVLASSYDPYTLILVNQPIRTVFPKNSNVSQYVKKQYFQNLFSIEANRASIANPLQLAKSYFPPKFHWIPEHGERIYSIILISCVMKNPLLLELYQIKMIPPKLFTTVFSWLISFSKENGALPLVPPEGCHLLPFPIHIMIISLLGLDSWYTRMKTCLIPGLLNLINISLLICLFGSTIGGLNLALLLKYL